VVPPRRVLVTASALVVTASASAALLAFTDLPLFVVYAVWVGPVVGLLPYAYPGPHRRSYGLWTALAALVLPVGATVWVVWLVLDRTR
jgi:hypothetical protein